MEKEGARRISDLYQNPEAPLSARTYPVLARVALTLTHTATKTAGKPVGAEQVAYEGPQAAPTVFLPSAHPARPILLILNDPRMILSLSLTPHTLGSRAAW